MKQPKYYELTFKEIEQLGLEIHLYIIKNQGYTSAIFRERINKIIKNRGENK